jgi:hypothetical protein
VSSNVAGLERHAKTLRAWQLAIPRFAVTLDHADRLAVLMIAAEIDGIRPKQENEPAFSFFRKTSAELCAAMLRPNETTSAIQRQHLARIDDERLKRCFAAALAPSEPTTPSVGKPVKRDENLWRGLSSRRNQAI